MRYLRLIFYFFKISLIAELEFRANIITKIIADVIWYLCQLSLFEVLFLHIPRIGQWDLSCARLFMAYLFVVDAIYMFFFNKNFGEMRTYSQSGELDLLLAKPINSQFFVSLRQLDPTYLINAVFLSVYFYWAFTHLSTPQNPLKLLLLFVLVPASLATIYAIAFSINCLAIIFTRAEYATFLWYQIYRFGTRPDSIYPPWLRILLMTTLPASLIASVPARLLMFRFDGKLAFLCISIPLCALWMSTLVWKKAVKNYSSASS